MSSTHSSNRVVLRRSASASLSVLALLGLAIAPAFLAHAQGQPNEPRASAASSSGEITGRVFNAANGTYLNNARVSVEGTSIETYTDPAGNYRLRGLPLGPVQVKVTFTGQDPLTKSIEILEGSVAKLNFTFHAAGSNEDGVDVVLDPFEVKASHFRNQVEIALNEERAAVNIKSVVATDSLGYVADGNVGDFVRFLPGVDISYGDGTAANPDNAVAVGVRGFGADSTAILIDGVPVASGSPSGLSRTVQLDGLSINNISRLEVIKVATPDMPQDSPGGAINLVSRSAFELPRATYNLSVAFNANTNDYELLKKSPGPNGDMIYKTQPNIRFGGSVPLLENLGLSFSVASDNKYSLTRYANMRDWYYENKNTTASGTSTPVQNANGGIRIDNPVMYRYEVKEYQWVENRLSGSLGLDWRPIDGLDIKLSGNFNTYENTGVTYRTQWGHNNAVGIADWGPDYITGFQRTATFNPSLRTDMTVDARDKEGFTTQGTLSVKYSRNGWNLAARASASESYAAFPDKANGHFSTIDMSASNVAGRLDFLDIDKGTVGEIRLYDRNGDPLDYGHIDQWNQFTNTGGRARSSEAENRDLVKQYNFDVGKDIDFLPFPVTVKAGAQQKSKSQHKWGAGTSYGMIYVGPSVPNSELESVYATSSGLGYANPQYWPDTSKIYDIYVEHPEYFDDQLVSPVYNLDMRAENYESRVNNTKGLTITDTDVYGMLTAKFWDNKITLITGARQSRKDTKGYNVFNNPKWAYVLNSDGTIYRDDVYTKGVKYNGQTNSYGTGDPRTAADVVMTDAALRARMDAAGVAFLPDQLYLAPNGTAASNYKQNLHFAQVARYTKNIDTSLTQPWTPQVQVAYEITDQIRAQLAWSRETRLPDLEGTNGILVGGSSFQVSENDEPTPDLGGDGSITINNVKGAPEINNSYNVKLSYYPRNGLGRYSVSYYYKIVDNAWETLDYYNDSPEYDELLASMGLDALSYPNYRISTTSVTGDQVVRKGFEVELNQNLGLFGEWGRAFDAFLTYSRRPVTTSSRSEEIFGFIPRVPVRAKWAAGLSFSARRLTAQARMTWTDGGVTYNGSGTTVALPDGTKGKVQLYNLYDGFTTPPELKIDLNYALTERFTLFANGNKVLSGQVHSRISDDQTGYMPDWATYRTMTGRGVTVTAGVKASF